MNYSSSTFKSSIYTDSLIDQNVCAVASNLNVQTATLNFGYEDDCEAYYNLLDGLKKIHAKVDSGDLSDFTE